MIKITIEDVELFDEEKSEFFIIRGKTITLEHSLVSLSKWESIWEKPFLSKEEKTTYEVLDYIRHMTITQNVHPSLYNHISKKEMDRISNYIDSPMTATTFNIKNEGGINREVITAEIIYYWMINFNIPFECQKWHLNRLLALINVCNIKNKPTKKMSRKEHFAQQRALNAARRKRLNTTG